MRLNLNVINDELAKLGYTARLDKGDGYFYFRFGEAADWLDCKVGVRTINTLTMKKWIAGVGGAESANRADPALAEAKARGTIRARRTPRAAGGQTKAVVIFYRARDTASSLEKCAHRRRSGCYCSGHALTAHAVSLQR